MTHDTTPPPPAPDTTPTQFSDDLIADGHAVTAVEVAFRVARDALLRAEAVAMAVARAADATK